MIKRVTILLLLYVSSVFTGCTTANYIDEELTIGPSVETSVSEETVSIKNDSVKVISPNIEIEKDIRGKVFKVYDKHYHYLEVHEDKIYVIYRWMNSEDATDWADTLWRFSPTGVPINLYEGKGIDFRVSPDNEFIAVESEGILKFFDSEGSLKKVFTEGDLEIGEYCDIGLCQWNDAGNVLWLESLDTYVAQTFIRIDVNTWNTDIYPNRGVYTDDRSLNPNTGWIVCSDYPVFLDTIGRDNYLNSNMVTKLFLYDVEAQREFEINSLETNLFSPQWESDEEISYMYGNEERFYSMEDLEAEEPPFDYEITKDNLSEVWGNVWHEIGKKEGALSVEQIEEINHFLKPVLISDKNHDVNPISCFFTSFYGDTKDIDLADFLMYFPGGEVPKELPEFDELKNLEHWPFPYVSELEDMIVPIHRYESNIVQEIFLEYGGISMDALSGIGFDGVYYLDSTDAYYNYTSDFGPGVFICTSGEVKNGRIKLNGDSRNGSYPVLTIVEDGDRYLIQSYTEQ